MFAETEAPDTAGLLVTKGTLVLASVTTITRSLQHLVRPNVQVHSEDNGFVVASRAQFKVKEREDALCRDTPDFPGFR